MSIDSLLDQTISVERFTAGTSDAEGNAGGTWAEVATYKAKVSQRTRREGTGTLNEQVSDWVAYIRPSDADVRGRDRLVVDGTTFEVLGLPAVRRRPGSAHHVEASLQVVSI